MKLLLNTATRQKGIILFSDTKIVSAEYWDIQGAELAHILPNLHKILQETSTDMSEIEECIVIVGPGSFTGVRLAVNIVNTLKFIFPNLIVSTLTTGELFSALDLEAHDQYVFQSFLSDVFYFEKNGSFLKREDVFFTENSTKCCGELLLCQEEIDPLHSMELWNIDDLMNLAEMAHAESLKSIEPFYGKGANITVKKKEH